MPAWAAVTLGIVGVTLVLAGVLAVTVVPPVLANVTSEVADTDVPVAIAEGADATVTVPAGWVVQHPPFSTDSLRLRTPDGMLEITLAVTSDPPALDDNGLSQRVSETLTSGLPVDHALDAGSQTLFAVVGSGAAVSVGTRPGTPIGRSATVSVTARVAADAEYEDYTAAIAQVLDGIRGVP